MNWYYVVNGQQVGPVSQTDFDNLVATGVIQPGTLVWRDGLPEWQPYSNLSSGTPPPVAATGGASVAEVSARDYTVDIGGTIGAGWAFYKANFGSVLGATMIFIGISIGVGCIPFIGSIANLILVGPLLGGLYLFILGKMRGAPVTPSHVFVGFKTNFGGLLLSYVVPGLLVGLSLIPGAVLIGVGVFTQMASHHGGTPPNFHITAPLIAGIVLLAIAFFVAMYLQNCWLFTISLVADKRLNFWPAMQLSRAVVRKHWWSIFGLMFVTGLLVMLGILGCGVGIFFTMPLAFVVQMHQYEQLFADLAPQNP